MAQHYVNINLIFSEGLSSKFKVISNDIEIISKEQNPTDSLSFNELGLVQIFFCPNADVLVVTQTKLSSEPLLQPLDSGIAIPSIH